MKRISFATIVFACVSLLLAAVLGWRLAATPDANTSASASAAVGVNKQKQPTTPPSFAIPAQVPKPAVAPQPEPASEDNGLPSNEDLGKFLRGEADSSVK